MSDTEKSLGYKRALDRHPHLKETVPHFEQWLGGVEEWLVWIDKNVPDNTHASRAEVLEDFHFTPLGLELMERLGFDIHPSGREVTRTEYDVKKLLRAVVALPIVARLQGKRLDRKHHNINTVFKEIINEFVNGDYDIENISKWSQSDLTRPEDIQ